MAYDYVEIGGGELINPSRTAHYIKTHLPRLDLECEIPNVGTQMGSADYSSPLADGAPWVSADPASQDFYGALVITHEGLRDSTQTVDVAELKGDGAIPGLRRNSSREVRFSLALYAKTDEALQYGIDWYAHALSGGYCPAFGTPYCEGEMMTVIPLRDTMAKMAPLIRNYYDVKTLQSVKETGVLNYKNAKSKTVDFILVCGNPFIYRAGSLFNKTVMPVEFTGTHTEEYCDPEQSLYDNFITDPALGSVRRPPRPPMVSPVVMPESWVRATTVIPKSALDVPGQAIFRTRIRSTGAIRMLRLRFYRPGAANCDYSGEFLITYKPGGQDMVIDGLSNKIWIERPAGHVPSGNLVIGSDGRPARWPVLDCQQELEMRVDYPVAPHSSVRVFLEVHNRR